ncbi:MAG: sensor histidine kinase [Bacillota bacterium]
MESFGLFFEANQVVFHFADGLVFFLLGVVGALAAHTFRESRLAIVGALPWLALFGLLVGAAKWGVIFVPLQAAYLPEEALHALRHLDGLLLVAGHAALLIFGLRLTAGEDLRWWATASLLLGIAGTSIALALSPMLTWEVAARALAAYGFGLPGAVLAGQGLIRQGREVAAFYPRPARALHWAAWAFLLSVPLGPLAIPLEGGPSFRLAGVPVEVGLIAGGLFLMLTLFGGLEALRWENLRRIERAERREAMLEERYRLAKELKDGAIQDLVATGMLIGAIEPDLPPAAQSHLHLVERQLQSVVDRLRTYLMDLRPMDWEEPDLYRGLRLLVEEFQANSLLPVELELQEGLTVAPEVGRDLYLVVHEALSNIRRHSGARQVRLALRPAGTGWLLEVADDGEGFDPAGTAGPGLERMSLSAARAGGEVRVESTPGHGTRVALALPYMHNGNTPSGVEA